MKKKWFCLFLFCLLGLFVAPSHSKAPTELERLAQGEVIITPTATGFACKFILPGDPQKAWDQMEDLDNWRKMFTYVLSSHNMKVDGKPDYESRGMYRNNRKLYVKGRYRGQVVRMIFDAQIQGYKPVTPAKTSATPSRTPSVRRPSSSGGLRRPTPTRRSYFRGGSISLSGPSNNISGNRFINLKNFLKVSMSVRATRLRKGVRYINAGQVTLNVNIDYQNLFISDRAISLFRLDYRSSEFDHQVRIGLQKIAEDMKAAVN